MDQIPCALEMLRPDETCQLCRLPRERSHDNWELARRGATDIDEPQPLILVA